MLWHAYVDESGDRGWIPRPANLPPGQRSGSSRVFAMTAVIVPDGSQPALLRSWDTAATQIGRHSGDVVHWQNVKASGQRKHLVSTITSFPGVVTISVVLCKWHLPNVSAISSSDYLYNWTLRLLVERLSWFGANQGGQVSMTFAQVMGFPPKRVLAYVDLLRNRQTNVEWSALRLPLRIDTPANRRMLQVADTASGAVFAAFEPDAYGYTDQAYIEMLRPVMWRRPWRPLWKDGLKFGPWPNEDCAKEHPWFEAFTK